MSRFSSISIFTGAGGLDYGLECAGFETLGAFESDSHCVTTLRTNRRWPVFQTVISSRTNILGILCIKKGAVDLMAGGPPCQPFSHAASWVNGWPNGLGDDRARTVHHFMRLARQVLPRVILLENVPGFARAGRGALEYVLKSLRQTNRIAGTNYKPFMAVLDAADYGVPQHRKRLFLVASRNGERFEFPSATHSSEASAGLLRHTTAWDALRNSKPGNFEDLRARGRWADLLPSIPEGQNYLWHTSRGEGLPLFGWRTRYWSFLLKLAKDRPSWTIPASPSQNAGPFHWENRLLGTEEMLRLQTFPEDIVICGNRTARQRQIGNAVPSLLGEVLGREIISQLLAKRPKMHQALTLSVSLARNIPIPAQNRPVPDKYLCLTGRHNPHPGTGRGPRAKHRVAGPNRVNNRD
jgi:DNA (cytosine-5)-methyltransferase 1